MSHRAAIVLASVGFLAFIVYRASQAPQKQSLIGTKMVRLAALHSFNEAWKKDYPEPTNLWGHSPYGWSGLPANAYLRH